MRTLNYFFLLALMFTFLFSTAQDTKKSTVKKKPVTMAKQDDKKKSVKQQDSKKGGKDTTTKNSNARAISNKGLPTKGTTKKESLKTTNPSGGTDTTQKVSPK